MNLTSDRTRERPRGADRAPGRARTSDRTRERPRGGDRAPARARTSEPPAVPSIADLRTLIEALKDRSAALTVSSTISDDEFADLREKLGVTVRRLDAIAFRRLREKELSDEIEKDPTSPYRHFLCPITREIMKRPIVVRDGHSYERDAIVTHIAGRRTFTSPMTNTEFPSEPLISNNDLRSQIQEKLDSMDVVFY